MEINAKRINELAKEMDFIRDNLEKMARLLQMLDVVFASPWKDKLVLKGGTNAELFEMPNSGFRKKAKSD